MTTRAQLRKAALAQPEVEEGTHFGMPAFLVGGKGFASMTKDGHVQLSLPETDVEAALAMCPSGEPVRRGGTQIGFEAPLADVNGKDLNDLRCRAWAHRAPKRLVKAAAATESAADQAVGDLLPSVAPRRGPWPAPASPRSTRWRPTRGPSCSPSTASGHERSGSWRRSWSARDSRGTDGFARDRRGRCRPRAVAQ